MNTDILLRFRHELLDAFSKMIRGINVELSEHGLKILQRGYPVSPIPKNWFIIAIHEDEMITIIAPGEEEGKKVKLNFVKLND